MLVDDNIYLDYNATSPVLKEVVEAVSSALQLPSNPSSVHAYGRHARKVVEGARKQIQELVGASEAYQVIFTGSGTEANNLALKGFTEDVAVLCGATEHVSVIKAVEDVQMIPVDANGIVKLEALETMLNNLNGKKALVSVQLANNETGVVQPVEAIAKCVFAHGGYVHCDATQAVGKLDFDVQQLNVDMLSVSAHKFGGPLGVGALVIKKGIKLQALAKGGGQEQGFRAGTENVPAISGFGVAAAIAKTLDKKKYIEELRDYFEAAIKNSAPEAVFFGIDAPRLPNTSLVALPGVNSETQLIALDLAGFSVSAGSACSSGKVAASHVLEAMGVKPEEASSAIRISIGEKTTKDEIDAFIVEWKKLYTKQYGKVAKVAAA